MFKQGISGGMINLKSFINRSDFNEIKSTNLRTASTLREAAKDGLQSLYAEVDDVLDKYKDTDVIKIMNELRDEKLLWVRARSIDADTVNANGDYFSKAELLKEVDIITTDSDGKKVRTKGPAYKTFEGVPIYANHKNDDVLEAKGMVVHAEWDDDENCVYCVFYIDESAYPDIARGVRVGYMHDVSMGCQVESGECSECGNIAAHEKDYCECLKKFKGKIHPKTGKKVYEKNMGIKFIELSVVGDGAFDTCEIEEIYDKDDILSKAVKLEKKASDLHANLMLAASNLPNNIGERRAMEANLRQISSASNAALKIAQTLVGGPLLAQDGAGANATVSNILKYLGIDPGSGLNILDMLNLALNFLEVSIINMFARKDNVDLAHVSKISKSMADLQATMQDLIDDGVDSGGQQQAPINQGQLQQQQGQAAQPAQVAQQSYSPAGNVGQMMNPVLPPEMANAVGGGAVASNKNQRMVVWSHSGEEVASRVATASTVKKITMGKALENLAEALGNNANFKLAESNKPIKTNSPTKVSGGKSMSIWDKFTQQRRLKQAAKATEKFELEDKAGNKIVISSKGDVEAYHNNKRVAWEPNITDEHFDAIASGNGIEVAAEFLSDFSKAVTASKNSGRSIVANWEPKVREDVYEAALEPMHKGSYDDVIEDLLGSESAERYKRSNPAGEESQSEMLAKHGGDVDADKMQTREELLDDAGLYGRHISDDDVKEALLEDARKGNPDEVIEDQLAEVHKVHSNSTPGNIIKAALTALSNAVVASQVTPEEIVDLTVALAKKRDFAHLIKLAELGSKSRIRVASRLDFHNKNLVLNPTAAIFNELGKVASSEVSAKDLHDVLATVSANYESVTKTITASAQEIIKHKNVIPTVVATKASRTELLKAAMASHLNNDENVGRDHLKTALMAFAAASEDALVTPTEVIDSISEMDADDLTARIEFAKNEKSISERIATRARKEFYGASRFASVNDLTENTIGWLADYSLEYEQSSKSIADAVMLATENPRVASNLVAKLIKTAKITITDERVVTKRISATCEELGLDPKSEDFEAQFRDKAISLLQSSGYTVDPNTFSLNDVVVSADGYVSASVTSRFTKTFDTDSVEPVGQTVEPTDGAENPENLGPVGQPVEDEAIETDAAKQLRASKRKQILERIAQMAPGMTPGMAPGMAPSMPGMAGAAGTPAIGALTMANEPEAGDEASADMDTDNMPEPGKKVPIGGICPACGSKNVDLADGKGHCNTCQTDMEIRYQITVMPNSDTENDKSTEEESTSESPLGGDVGLGAATAPAPEAPMGAAGGAPLAPGAPAAPAAPPAAGMTPMAKSAPIMVRLSWTQNPEVFIKAAQPDFDPETEKILPVGHICPSCGDRHAKKVQNNRFCYNCGEVYIPRIHRSADKSRVEVSIDKIV
jgi:ssDNA-binding Zn-finger/Zn-ribbon topoisomerase 1